VDVGDRFSRYCILDAQAEVIEEGRIATTEKGFRQQFADVRRCRIAFECGTHSPWISRLLAQWGHQVLVANAREVPTITHSVSKNDRRDAEQLARLAHADPRLLKPIRHRSAAQQRDLNWLRARDTLVRSRTLIVNSLRGMVKSAGGRLPQCSTESFPAQAPACLPPDIAPVAAPLLDLLTALNAQIAALDVQIEALAARHPEIRLLRTVPGVGPLVAAAYVLTLGEHQAIARSRQAGAWLGLRPGRKQSGDCDPQRSISKTGDRYLRRLLVQSAHYTLGKFARDSALRRWGLKLAGTGNQGAKKRAVVAVARKLAVILHAMWRTGQSFQPFPPPAARGARQT
jgi:transposase